MIAAEQIKADFDELACVADASGSDRYDAFLISLVPRSAISVLDIGCGLGRLTQALAIGNREVIGVDLSSLMIKRARLSGGCRRVSFIEGDFLALDFRGREFDCVVSAAALHHMPYETALSRMAELTRPGGRLIIQDLRCDTSLLDSIRSYGAFAYTAFTRFIQTGWPLPERRVREAWARHGANEVYLSRCEAQELANRYLPGARVLSHWLWRYTIVWDKPQA